MDGDAGGAVGAIVKILTDLGLPGLVIGVLGWAYWQIEKRNATLNDKMVDTLTEAAREHAKATSDSTAAINRLADMLLRGKASE